MTVHSRRVPQHSATTDASNEVKGHERKSTTSGSRESQDPPPLGVARSVRLRGKRERLPFLEYSSQMIRILPVSLGFRVCFSRVSLPFFSSVISQLFLYTLHFVSPRLNYPSPHSAARAEPNLNYWGMELYTATNTTRPLVSSG